MIATIFDIKHFAVHDGPGIRQTVFFKGCPLNCIWCHNPESKSINLETYTRKNYLDGILYEFHETIGYDISVDKLLEIILGDKVFFDESGGGVSFSGGEPLMQSNFLIEIAKKCRKKNIHTCLDTSGFSTQEAFIKVANEIDCFLFDLKIINEQNHKKFTGVSAKHILDNLIWLDNNNIQTIIRIPLIPEITCTEENIADILGFLGSLKNIIKINLLPFHEYAQSKYKRFNKEYRMLNVNNLDENELKNISNIFEKNGFEVKIGG
ncbi:MAG: glycyl-radical enzyme activating protein [Bacteroidales bacterium]|nr:glycyl-radical enzyme activating protein [Bacteroidales bacterium]